MTERKAVGGMLGQIACVGVVVMAVSIVFNNFGILHFEWWHYLPYHLGPGSVWKKIFDSQTLDLGVYTGRELSYLVDHIDAQMIALSVKCGLPLFISITHVALAIGLGVWIARFAARDLRLGSLVGLLLALLFWTTPFIYLHFLLRTAKILTAAGVVILVVECWRATATSGARERGLGIRFWISIGTSALVMSFADRQGFYFLLLVTGAMAVHWWQSGQRVARTICLLLVAVGAAETIYFFHLAPALTRRFWGYDPSLSFNELPWAELLSRPGFYARESLILLFQTIRFCLGSIPSWVVLAVVVAVTGLAWRKEKSGGSERVDGRFSLVFVAALAGLWVMYGLMILRHPPLLWPDVQVAYYWIPTAALTMLGLAGGLAAVITPGPVSRRVVVAALLAVIGGNLLALPRHQRELERGHLRDSIAATAEVRYALMHRGDPRYRVPDEVIKIDAYQALVKLAPVRIEREPSWDEVLLGEFYRATSADGAPVRFLFEFGGNVDPRFLHTTGRFQRMENGQRFIGTSAERAELRINLPSNRLQGEFVLQRASGDNTGKTVAEFAIYASPSDQIRYERWRSRVELPAGQSAVVVPYAIDSSHLPTLFTVENPGGRSGETVAGWRHPTITDTGGDKGSPTWLTVRQVPDVPLRENELERLLPAGWRPVEGRMRGGRLTDRGLALEPGGEIWLKVRGIVTRFVGTVRGSPAIPGPVTGAWYKAGRLHVYGSPTAAGEDGSESFQAMSGEAGGWIVITAAPAAEPTSVVVQVTDVHEE